MSSIPFLLHAKLALFAIANDSCRSVVVDDIDRMSCPPMPCTLGISQWLLLWSCSMHMRQLAKDSLTQLALHLLFASEPRGGAADNLRLPLNASSRG